jgi:3'-phosphoadenosine 5'-phosphosulfate sulfotransferase (PAPS reductase)/FAD synthetase
MSAIRHVLGISGGKDSAALAIYLKNLYPSLEIDYYSSDTGKELDETYKLVDNLQIYLEKKITILKGAEGSPLASFDHFLKIYGGYLPSTQARWCTKKLKLEPFEKYVGNDQVVSYVGIRGDEDREGYISRKSNIQSIFPFRQNIWSEDVIDKFLANDNIDQVMSLTDKIDLGERKNTFLSLLNKKIDIAYTQTQKLNQLFATGVKEINRLVFEYLKGTNYPLGKEASFPLLENEEVIIRDDVFRILEESGVGVPNYYKKVNYTVGNQIGSYSRSRSGCYFCFYQQKIEWIWLYEQHPELFEKALEYEKDGYTWNQEESLTDIIRPERMEQIKYDFIKRQERANSNNKSKYLLDILDDEEGLGCASCFI